MAKSLFLVAALLLLLPLLSLAEAAEPRKALADPKTVTEAVVKNKQVGAYQPIQNVTSPDIQLLGKFAVDEYNKRTHSHLVFQKVISGKYQIVAGTNYDLQLNAIDGTIICNYSAIIYKNLKGNLTLISFCHLFKN